jgi:hypothetical protein
MVLLFFKNKILFIVFFFFFLCVCGESLHQRIPNLIRVIYPVTIFIITWFGPGPHPNRPSIQSLTDSVSEKRIPKREIQCASFSYVAITNWLFGNEAWLSGVAQDNWRYPI